MSKSRINKEEKRNQLHAAYRQRHDLIQRQAYAVEDGLTYEDDRYRELSKNLADTEADIEKLKGELGL